MKKLASLLLILTGCALFQGTQQEKIYNLSYAASSIGTSSAIMAKPEYRPGFELAWTALDSALSKTNLTGQGLREIIGMIPAKELNSPQARIAIEQATFLFDLSTGGRFNLETNLVNVVAAGRGIRDGMGVALGK